jgi:hypothetical protein
MIEGLMLGSLLTNFSIEQRVRYETAIKIYKEITGKDILYIEEKAFDSLNQRLYNTNSIHTRSRGTDLSDFWEVFRNLQESWTLKSV